MDFIKEKVRRLLRRSGYELLKFDARNHGEIAIGELIIRSGVDCILDVGANCGQFGKMLREAGIKVRIVSFEPLPDAHDKLVRVADKDPNWIVSARMALGAASGEVGIYVAGNSVSSSLLPMADLHVSAAPGSRVTSREIVPISTLSEEFDKCDGWGGHRFLLKIDTQGYEPEVLDGLGEKINRVSILICELSCVSLYQGQKLFPQFLTEIVDRGFEIFRIEPEFVDRVSGQTYQLNGIFINPSHVA